MEKKLLSGDEARLWYAWKLASENVMALVGKDIVDGTGISGWDYGILSRLVDLGRGEMRQQDLAVSMKWDKSRLSHHLTRMENRGLVRRRPSEAKGVDVLITPAGQKVLAKTRPVHAQAVRTHLLEKIGKDERKVFLAVCERLWGETDDDDEEEAW